VKTLSLGFLILAAFLIVVFAYAANPEMSKKKEPNNYEVTELPPLDGTSSAGNSINNRQWVTGVSSQFGDEVVRATLWIDGLPTDLGALGGSDANSAVLWPVKNKKGVIAGISQTDTIDPNGEEWSCSFFIPFTGHTCVGFRWEDGEMSPLPTLGGNNGFATGVDQHGRIVGWAENTVVDPLCDPLSTQVLQFRPVIWDEEDEIQELPLFPGDSSGSATAINDKDQIVGISGICDQAVGRRSAIHAVIWEEGIVTDLGNIGGDAWNTPMAINKHGEVVGFANIAPGTGFNAHAFRWTEETGMEDLDTLPNHAISQALGINKKGQIVGMSCATGFADCRAFIYENGEMTDLNTLVPGFSGHLVFANDINDKGEITGGTGDGLAFLAIPISKTGTALTSAQVSTNPAEKGRLSENVRKMLLKRLGLAAIPLLQE
jgi:probable HAF family extracellular repeat protein